MPICCAMVDRDGYGASSVHLYETTWIMKMASVCVILNSWYLRRNDVGTGHHPSREIAGVHRRDAASGGSPDRSGGETMLVISVLYEKSVRITALLYRFILFYFLALENYRSDDRKLSYQKKESNRSCRPILASEPAVVPTTRDGKGGTEKRPKRCQEPFLRFRVPTCWAMMSQTFPDTFSHSDAPRLARRTRARV